MLRRKYIQNTEPKKEEYISIYVPRYSYANQIENCLIISHFA